jgi:hypothetical protein
MLIEYLFYIFHLFSYAGDAHIKSKVKGIICGIKDIQFVGDLRIILSPLINTIPLVGAVTYFFLRKPVRIKK